MSENNITALILTYNEEANIKKCLEKLTWTDEILVVDSGSTDKTIDIAKEMGANVVYNKFENFSAQRTWAIKQASSKWILTIDADEILPNTAEKEIREAIESKQTEYYAFYRDTWLMGKKMKNSAWSNEWIVRLYLRDKVKYSGTLVHESVDIEKNKVKTLKTRLEHHTHQSMESYFAKGLSYTSLAAQDMYKKGKKTTCFSLFFSPWWKFIHTLLFRGAYKDGIRGIFAARLAANYTFQKLAKLWEIQEKNKTR